MYRRKVLNFRVIFSCGAWSKIVWKMKITVQPVPKNCFRAYLEAEKVMFIVLEWKELGVYDVRYNNVRQSSHKKMPRERGSRKKEGTNRTKKKYVFFGDSASHFERSPNQGQWRVLMDHLLFMVCTNNKLLFIACDEATQKEEDCYESWELIWGIFPAALAPVLRLECFTNYFFELKKEYTSR